jgi:hypothetical protein
MELTIQYLMNKWVVTNKQPVFSKIIYIECDEADEAMEILQQLNGKPYEVIDAFHRTRERLG